MPPYRTWVTGREAIARLIAARCPGGPGDHLLVPTAANGRPAFGTYLRGADGVHRAHSLHVLTLAREGVAGVVAFLDPGLFGLFGLPLVRAEG